MNDVFTIMNTIMNTFVHTAFSLIFLTSFQMYRKVISLKKSQISSLHFPNIKILLYLLPLFLFPFLCVSLPVFVYVVFFWTVFFFFFWTVFKIKLQICPPVPLILYYIFFNKQEILYITGVVTKHQVINIDSITII